MIYNPNTPMVGPWFTPSPRPASSTELGRPGDPQLAASSSGGSANADEVARWERAPDVLVRSEWHQSAPSCSGCFGCLFFCCKATEVNRPSPCVDLGIPTIGFSVQVDTTVSGRAFLAGHVLAVALWGNGSQVAAPVIQAVPVDVIDDDTVTTTQGEKLAVQVHRCLSQSPAVVAHSIAVLEQEPAVATNGGGIGSINQGVRADRAVSGSQGDAHCPIRAGIIHVHRQITPVGAGPTLATTTSGPLAFNYTPSFEWRAA